jgi:hypothetical protein
LDEDTFDLIKILPLLISKKATTFRVDVRDDSINGVFSLDQCRHWLIESVVMHDRMISLVDTLSRRGGGHVLEMHGRFIVVLD